ncbi:MAG: DUF4921 family protein [Propionibacteriaceae bacterium]|uniref:HIT-like domain n=2 Tax=Propionibacterium ruminifibrarum TaxID=1962131 RepID=A0A375I0J0_9ACTN|nr:DUF4921 family protein [Propionibacteriaceae bacterium]SPF67605.1 HIT-like domain [Propionibacterium ruminifibrarum]
MPDGTVKQINPLSGVEVWTVPGRGNRPLTRPAENVRPLQPGDSTHACVFCLGRMSETPPPKSRRVKTADGWQTLSGVLPSQRTDTVAEFRRVPNLFEILGFSYWRTNYDYRPSPSVMAAYERYRNDPAGRQHLLGICRAKLAASGLSPDQIAEVGEEKMLEDSLAFFASSHDVIVARRHYMDFAADSSQLAGSGSLSVEEHEQYTAFTIEALHDLYEENRYARYVAVFQNWLQPAGASIDHLHKQLVAMDEHGAQTNAEVAALRANINAFNQYVLNEAVQHNLVIAENDSAIAFAGFGHRYPTVEIYSKSSTCEPWLQSPEEVADMSALLHAIHAATGTEVPCNEEWHHRSPDMDVPMPWHINLKWRVSTLAGFEGGTKVYLNTIDPWHVRDRLVPRLHELRREGHLADGILLDEQCPARYNSLKYNPLLQS